MTFEFPRKWEGFCNAKSDLAFASGIGYTLGSSSDVKLFDEEVVKVHGYLDYDKSPKRDLVVISCEMPLTAYRYVIHKANLSPYLPDERKGAPRSPIRSGEKVHMVKTYVVKVDASYKGTVEGWTYMRVDQRNEPIPEKYTFEQIDRRVRDKGRTARKVSND